MLQQCKFHSHFQISQGMPSRERRCRSKDGRTVSYYLGRQYNSVTNMPPQSGDANCLSLRSLSNASRPLKITTIISYSFRCHTIQPTSHFRMRHFGCQFRKASQIGTDLEPNYLIVGIQMPFLSHDEIFEDEDIRSKIYKAPEGFPAYASTFSIEETIPIQSTTTYSNLSEDVRETTGSPQSTELQSLDIDVYYRIAPNIQEWKHYLGYLHNAILLVSLPYYV